MSDHYERLYRGNASGLVATVAATSTMSPPDRFFLALLCAIDKSHSSRHFPL